MPVWGKWSCPAWWRWSTVSGYGLGASDVEIDGVRTPARKSVAAGINLNDLVPPDPTRKGLSALAEHMGGPAARQGIPVRIEKV